MRGLEGRTALVTGAAGGIGGALVETLASCGVNVAMTDVSTQSMAEQVEKARGHGVAAEAFLLDATRPASFARVIGTAAATLGPISLGVTCAGVIKVTPVLDIREEDWDRTFDINLKGTFFVLQALARHMAANGTDGRLVAVSSVAARSGRPDVADYAASKAGVLSVVQSLALALAPSIRVNAVCPGVVDTPMTAAIHQERAAEARERAQNAQELGNAQESGDNRHNDSATRALTAEESMNQGAGKALTTEQSMNQDTSKALTAEESMNQGAGRSLTAEESMAAMIATIPLQAAATPREVADAIVFLLSDSASYITGQPLYVCGGLATFG